MWQNTRVQQNVQEMNQKDGLVAKDAVEEGVQEAEGTVEDIAGQSE